MFKYMRLLVLPLAVITAESYAADCSSAPSYGDLASYAEGDLARHGNTVYRCKVGGWCSHGGPWAPGKGWAVSEAWDVVGTCDAGLSAVREEREPKISLR